MTAGHLLVLGLGNAICSDDGVGPIVAAWLQRFYDVPSGVRVLDGGTLGLALLPYLEDAGAAILVDAVRTDGPPGALVRLEGDAVPPVVATRLSPHQVGVLDVLDAARLRGRLPAHLVLLGIAPATLELGVGCSAPVAARLPDLLQSVVAEAAVFGYRITPKHVAAVAETGHAPDLVGLLGLRGRAGRDPTGVRHAAGS